LLAASTNSVTDFLTSCDSDSDIGSPRTVDEADSATDPAAAAARARRGTEGERRARRRATRPTDGIFGAVQRRGGFGRERGS